MLAHPETIAFTGVAAGLVAAPGVDFAAVVRNAAFSRRDGVYTGIGVVTGLLVHTMAAVVGVAAVLAAHDSLFVALQVAGGAYLVYLAVKAFGDLARSRQESAAGTTAGLGLPAAGALASYRQGFLVNVLNPKAPVLFLSLLPQFIPAGVDPVRQSALLSGIVIACAAVWFPNLAVVAYTISSKLGAARVQRVLGLATAVLFLALGIRMLMSTWL
ncbi:LysE family translocator [Nocardia sp. CNY236]|uniref:LysE family translocator n=1 Tax=Nocardia sp. CNY236 TaxID=1169152 RepID=UPI00041835FF|nr:LysE family translocator [Nocardia sp. CNY236]